MRLIFQKNISNNNSKILNKSTKLEPVPSIYQPQNIWKTENRYKKLL
jgi:hypothetical protein